MIISVILLLISLVFESLIPNLLKNFIPFFMLASISIISTFNNNKNKIYKIIFIYGLLYDLCNTDLIFVHAFIYTLLFYIENLLLKKKKNFFLVLILYYFSIIIYSLLIYIYSFLSTNINFVRLFKNIIINILPNTIYFCYLYIIFIGIFCLIKNRNKNNTY